MSDMPVIQNNMLGKLPNYLLDMICSYLDRTSIRNCTMVSIAFRDYFEAKLTSRPPRYMARSLKEFYDCPFTYNNIDMKDLQHLVKDMPEGTLMFIDTRRPIGITTRQAYIAVKVEYHQSDGMIVLMMKLSPYVDFLEPNVPRHVIMKGGSILPTSCGQNSIVTGSSRSQYEKTKVCRHIFKDFKMQPRPNAYSLVDLCVASVASAYSYTYIKQQRLPREVMAKLLQLTNPEAPTHITCDNVYLCRLFKVKEEQMSTIHHFGIGRKYIELSRELYPRDIQYFP